MRVYLDRAEKIYIEINKDESDADKRFEFKSFVSQHKFVLKNLKQISNFIENEDGSLEIFFNNTSFIKIPKELMDVTPANEILEFEHNLITANEVRELSIPGKSIDDIRKINFDRRKLEELKASEIKLSSDLHSHYSTAISSKGIIKVLKDYNIDIPVEFIKDYENRKEEFTVEQSKGVKISLLSEEDIKYLETLMDVKSYGMGKFSNLTEALKARNKFMTNKNLFLPFIRQIAEEYKAQGISKVELSHTVLSSPNRFVEYKELIDSEEMDKICRESGVDIKFLIGIHKEVQEKKSKDETLKKNASIYNLANNSKRIIGCDFLGEEVKDIEEIGAYLFEALEYAYINNPNFVIRIHAGETNLENSTDNPDAIKTLLQMVKKYYKRINDDKGDIILPNLRIGHGINGINFDDQECIDLINEFNPIFEYNITSNNATGNVTSPNGVIIYGNDIQDDINKKYKKLIDIGAQIVVGTDGFGIYNTIIDDEIISYFQAGLELEDIKKISEVEKRICDDPFPNYSSQMNKTIEDLLKERKNKFEKMLDNYGVCQNEDKIQEMIKDKIPILISGASKNAWPNLSTEEKNNVSILSLFLTQVLDPQKCYFITGGTQYGVEEEFHKSAREWNKNRKFDVLGLFTEEAYKKGIKEAAKIRIIDKLSRSKEKKSKLVNFIISRKDKSFEDILVIDKKIQQKDTFYSEEQEIDIGAVKKDAINMALVRGKDWKDIAKEQYEFLNAEASKKKGIFLGIGGGVFVEEFIKSIMEKQYEEDGVKFEVLLDAKVSGASKVATVNYPQNGYNSIAEAITRIYEVVPEAFRKDFKIEQLHSTLNKISTDIDINREFYRRSDCNTHDKLFKFIRENYSSSIKETPSLEAGDNLLKRFFKIFQSITDRKEQFKNNSINMEGKNQRWII